VQLTVSRMQFNMDCEYRPSICGRTVEYRPYWNGRYVAGHFNLRALGGNAVITEYEVRLTDLVKRKCLYVSILQCMFRGWPFASPRPNEITTASKNGADRWYYIVANCLVKPLKTKLKLRSFYRNVFCYKEAVFSASRVCQRCDNY
jgi:hypothetical protein